MDQNGHSCLSDNGGTPQWHTDSETDVSEEFGLKVIEDHLGKGYFLVDEKRSKIVSKGELKPDSEVLLMPPIVGG